MLTNAALRNLAPKSKIYKAFDRDGIYVMVSPSGTVTPSATTTASTDAARR